MKIALALVLLAGCAGPMTSAPAPRVSCPACRDDVRVAVGQPIEVSTSWTGQCEPSTLDVLLSKNGDTGGESVSCGGAQYDVSVRCAAPCRLTDRGGSGDARGGTASGSGTLYIAPLVPGPFSFRVSIRHAGTGEEKAFTSPELVVRAPDGVGLYCHVPPDQRNMPDSSNVGFLTPCDGRPLSGEAPLVMPVAQFDGKTYVAADATLNGRADWPSHELRLTAEYTRLRSLRDLFPERVKGGRLAPGRYEVTVVLGGQTTTFPLTVAQ